MTCLLLGRHSKLRQEFLTLLPAKSPGLLQRRRRCEKSPEAEVPGLAAAAVYNDTLHYVTVTQIVPLIAAESPDPLRGVLEEVLQRLRAGAERSAPLAGGWQVHLVLS